MHDFSIIKRHARGLVESHIHNQGLRNHCYAVGFAMRGLAEHFHDDADLWEVIGILHDADWEETKDAVDQHTRKTVQWIADALKDHDPTQTAMIVRTILSHNYQSNGEAPPSNIREWSLYCCDELTGLIVANALIMPSRKLADVTGESVLKKMNSKSFAAAVDRSSIRMCEEKLSTPLPSFIQIILHSMQKNAPELGL